MDKYILKLVTNLNNYKALQVKYFKINLSKNSIILLTLLYRVGIIKKIKLIDSSQLKYKIYLKYTKKMKSTFKKVRFITKPSLKQFFSCSKLKKYKEDSFNSHVIIVSTKKGLMLDVDCLKYNIGGVPLLSIELY